MTVAAFNKGRPFLLDSDLILTLWPEVGKRYFEVDLVQENTPQDEEITWVSSRALLYGWEE